MKKTLLPLTLIAAAIAPAHAVLMHESNTVLGLRTNSGGAFGGVRPAILDTNPGDDPFLDDGSSRHSALNIDNNGLNVGGIDLTGDFFDYVFTFQFYDSDGVFSFTENMDDGTQLTVSPINGPTDLSSAGTPASHTDTIWNTRTNASFAFGSGGWFDVEVHFDENTGGAGLPVGAVGLGFGFDSTGGTNFGGVGYGATFDTDSASGLSWGSFTDSTSVADGGTTAALLGMSLLSLFGLSRRKRLR